MTVLAEVVVLCYGFVDVPGALELLGEDHEVTGAEAYRIIAVRNRYFAFE